MSRSTELLAVARGARRFYGAIIQAVIVLPMLACLAACAPGETGATSNVNTPVPAAPLEILTASLPGATQGSAYSVTLAAQGGSGVLTWAVATGAALPPGLTLSAAGELSGTPAVEGSYIAPVIVSDALRASVLADLALTVLPAAAVNPGLAIVTPSLPQATRGVAYTANVAASGSTTAAYLWTVSVATPLPAGLTLTNADQRIAAISGTAAMEGDYPLSLEVSDGAGQAAGAALTLTVAAPAVQAITISPATLPDATTNTLYDEGLACTDTGAASYIWSIASGAPPAGIYNVQGGVANFARIEGWLTAAGSYDFTIQVQDSNGNSGSMSYAVTVTDPPAVAPLEIATVALPAASVGAYYSSPVQATGGSAQDYSWSIVAGALPGLAITPAGTPASAVVGTPQTAGIYDFTVRVLDSAGNEDTQILSLAVTALPSWTAMSETNAPGEREWHATVWTGATGNPATSHRMIVWGGLGGGFGGGTYDSGGVFNPASNEWESFPNLNSGNGAPHPADNLRAVWTGNTGNPDTSNRMIVWGGGSATSGLGYMTQGGMYDPATDTWTLMSEVNAPPARPAAYGMFWSGNTGNPATANRVIVMGGFPGSLVGGIYDPAADAWTQIALPAMANRWQTSITNCVWTGDTGNPATSHNAIMWGDLNAADISMTTNTGVMYSPLTGIFGTILPVAAPQPRALHCQVWDDTNNRLLVWSGFYGGWDTNTGGIYDPATGQWTDMTLAGAPSARELANAVWTGTRMVVWGGGSVSGPAQGFTNTGGLFDPVANSWAPTPTQDAPAARGLHSMVWTGETGNPVSRNCVIVWGGNAGYSGGIYRP